ncbi:MAG: hypothetical protein ABEI13_01940 [Candidatus Paceibacteria bacterium]
MLCQLYLFASSFFVSTTSLLVISANLVVLQIAIIYQKIGSDIDESLSILNTMATVEPIHESDFYDRFQMDVRNADRKVFITYFKNESPYESNDAETISYYDNLSRIIENKADENVRFRRIIRGLPEMENWIDTLLETHEGNHNYSLCCVLDDTDDPHLDGHIPVQLTDNDITYFVAVGEQRETSAPRDMRIKSEEINSQWTDYNNRIWNKSLKLIDRGRIQEEAVEEYKKHIEEINDK